MLHFSIEQEIKDQQERCDKSLTTITELQRRIQESAKQIEAKDNKITELLNDVERLNRPSMAFPAHLWKWESQQEAESAD